MTFPVLRVKDLKQNKGNKYRQELKDRYLNETFSKCKNPNCKKQEVIEIAKPEENALYDFCLNCGNKKLKGELTHD